MFIQGNTSHCYDIVLGMDWLSMHSPMQIHWADKWLQFEYLGNTVLLQGLQSKATWGSPITLNQLQAMLKKDSVLYMVELNTVDEAKTEESIPPEIQAIISQYQSFFQPLPNIRP